MPESISSYWDVVEPVFFAIDIDDPGKYSASIAGVPRPVLVLYAAHFCLSEVRNGGFLQFFWNSTGIVAPEGVEGFKAVGLTELAGLLATATELLGSPYPRDRDERWDALLVASGRSEEELTKIFEGNANLYLAFQEAVGPSGLDDLNRQAWKLADSENGGFEEAATRYARLL
jgi:hypothetical protein